MIIFTFLVLCALAWLGLHVVAAPPDDWQTSYTRALARPLWAVDMPIGMSADFVSWTKVAKEVWDRDVAPSIAMVAAALSLRATLAEHNLLDGHSPLEKGACSVYYAHMLAGAKCTPEEATVIAMRVFYAEGFAENATETAAAFVAKRRAFFSRVVPAALKRVHTQIQADFELRVIPLRHEWLNRLMPQASTSLAAFRKV